MEQQLEKYFQTYIPGMAEIQLLAIVTESCYEVDFYALRDGELQQGNTLAEQGILNPHKLDQFYKKVADMIRENVNFQADKINIFSYKQGKKASLTYKQQGTSNYSIKKEWKKEIQ